MHGNPGAVGARLARDSTIEHAVEPFQRRAGGRLGRFAASAAPTLEIFDTCPPPPRRQVPVGRLVGALRPQVAAAARPYPHRIVGFRNAEVADVARTGQASTPAGRPTTGRFTHAL